MEEHLKPTGPGRAGSLSPEEEIALTDLRVKQAGEDERKTCFCPETEPRPPRAGDRSEPVSDETGSLLDVQGATPRVDDLADFDLGTDDLLDADL